jgi:hypothetical protein
MPSVSAVAGAESVMDAALVEVLAGLPAWQGRRHADVAEAVPGKAFRQLSQRTWRAEPYQVSSRSTELTHSSADLSTEQSEDDSLTALDAILEDWELLVQE